MSFLTNPIDHFNKRNKFLTLLEAGKSKTKASVGSGSWESSLLGLKKLPSMVLHGFPLCVYVKREIALSFFLYSHQFYQIRTPLLWPQFNINYLIKWRRKWQPIQNSCLGNPMDRGAWWATVHGATRVRHDLVTKQPSPPSPKSPIFKYNNIACYVQHVNLTWEEHDSVHSRSPPSFLSISKFGE